MRGKNKDFVHSGLKMVFKRNYGIIIDTHEIDLSLSYGENFNILYEKYVSLPYHNICDL